MFHFGAVSLHSISSAHPDLVEEIKLFDPVKTASIFAGFLSEPGMQSNCFRLEALVHLALIFGNGNRKPNRKQVVRWFSSLGNGPCGSQEDPAEDVFVSAVATPKGNFRILEGTWESAAFFLQRVLNTVEYMPAGGAYDHIRASIHALLQLSDLVCERSKLDRYALGNPIPLEKLPRRLAENTSSLRRRIAFSVKDLEDVGLRLDLLEAFGFVPETRALMEQQTLGNTALERKPVAYKNGQVLLLLPTAVSPAIRRFVIEKMDAAGMREAFLAGLAREYSQAFSGIPLLGGPAGAPIEFKRTDNGLLAGFIEQADVGRYLNVVFFVDTFEDIEESGLGGTNLDPEIMVDDFDRWIDRLYGEARKQADFRDCITLLVGCGIGRGMNYRIGNIDRSNFRLITLNAADLYTLSWVQEFEPLSLWRLLDAQDRLSAMGVTLQNINGLLNMVAWARALGGHLVPHGDLPEEFEPGNAFIVIEQNSLRVLRHEVLVSVDYRRVQNVDGEWVPVRRINESVFAEDKGKPLYGGEHIVPGLGIPVVYLTSKRPWWCELQTNEKASGRECYERWTMLFVWLSRAAPVLEDVLTDLPEGPVIWSVKFEGDIGSIDRVSKRSDFEDALKSISVRVEHDRRTVGMTVESQFEYAIFHPENVAERALVSRMIDGFAELSIVHLTPEKKSATLDKIIPNSIVRQSHRFLANEFRDFVRGSVPARPITIHSDDDAALRLDLGWQARDRKLGGEIVGRTKCTGFLNSVVRQIENELCAELRAYDRRALIEMCLANHESAVLDRSRWHWTAGAVIALRDDKPAAQATIANREFELNAVFQATRLLIEIAICECPVEGGLKPGKLDFSRMMAKVMLVNHLGGCSDAIRWDAMEPRVRITPLGDIHLNYEFFDSVLVPFASVGSEHTVRSSIADYPTRLEEPEITPGVEHAFDEAYIAAWREEFGTSLDDMRTFVDYVEDIGIKKRRSVLMEPKSVFLNVDTDGGKLSREIAERILDNLTFVGRPSWRTVPKEYEDRDRQPWRFRRRLSILRKPFVQLDDGDDPTIVVAPGILRDAFAYMVRGYHRGDFPGWQLRTDAMKKWAGKSVHKRGASFSQDVADRLAELRWNVETEVPITKVLRKGFDRDYGDIDVLAWNDTGGRILVIECKNVQYRKTPGEIAEQLADFRGEINADGKPDLLRKHLDRMELLTAHSEEVAEYVGMELQPEIEGYLVFKNPVPMQYAWAELSKKVAICTYEELTEFQVNSHS